MGRKIMIRSEHALAEAMPATVATPNLSAHNLSFGSHDPTTVAPRLNQAITLKYAERKVVFEERQNADAIYQLVAGAVLISCSTRDSDHHAIEIVKPDGFFGMTSGAEFDCRAETLTRCTVRRIERSLIDGSPHAQRLLAQQFIRKVADFRTNSIRRSAAERVASLILSLPPTDDCGRREVDERIALTQAEMASMAGLAIETVCRVLRDLKRNGAISSSGRGRVAILDPAAIKSIAGS